jgi:thioredoxin-like negative regulator of GroEL
MRKLESVDLLWIPIIVLFCFCVGAFAQSFDELQGEQGLEELLYDAAETPVIVAFTASWCKPCKSLKAKIETIAEEFDEADVFIRWVDADKHKSLQKYLKGGYPTVRVFRSQSLAVEYFVGDSSHHKVREFILGVIDPQVFLPSKGMGGPTCPFPPTL